MLLSLLYFDIFFCNLPFNIWWWFIWCSESLLVIWLNSQMTWHENDDRKKRFLFLGLFLFLTFWNGKGIFIVIIDWLNVLRWWSWSYSRAIEMSSPSTRPLDDIALYGFYFFFSPFFWNGKQYETKKRMPTFFGMVKSTNGPSFSFRVHEMTMFHDDDDDDWVHSIRSTQVFFFPYY